MKTLNRLAAAAGVAVLVTAGTLSMGTPGAGAATTFGTFQMGSAGVVNGVGTIPLAGLTYHYSSTTPVLNFWTTVVATVGTSTMVITLACVLTGANMPTSLSLTCSGHIRTGPFSGCNVTHFPKVTVSHLPPPANYYAGSTPSPTFRVWTCTGGNTAMLLGALNGHGVGAQLLL